MKNMKPFFKAAVRTDGTLEMLVYEQLGKDWDGSGVSATDIKQQIDNAGPYNKIVCRINSEGGDAFEGIAIHNLLRAQGKPIEVCIDGVAASSASIVAMAGDKITVANNAMVMIHDAWTLCVGNAADMRKMADTLEKVSSSIAQTYVDRTGQSMDAVKAMMHDETWMSAEDCIKNGFATEIAEQPDESAMAMARTFKFRNLKNVPAALKNDESTDETVCACTCDNCVAKDCSNCTATDCSDPHCLDCPMQNEDAQPDNSNLTQYEARLDLLRLSK